MSASDEPPPPPWPPPPPPGMSPEDARRRLEAPVDRPDVPYSGLWFPDAPDPPPQPATRAATPVGWLLVRCGDEEAKVSLAPGQRYVLGRSLHCEVRLHDATVARRHAEVLVAPANDDGTPPRVHIRDNGSTNGLRLEGELHIDEHALRHRDVIFAGQVELVYLEAPPRPPALPPEPVRDPALEAEVAARPHDAEALSVWADWMQTRGCPLGELVALSLRERDRGGDPAAFAEQRQRLLEEHGERLLGPLARCSQARVALRDGLVELLRCTGPHAVPLGAIEELLARPAAIALRTVMAYERANGDASALLGALREHGQAARLRVLDVRLPTHNNVSAVHTGAIDLAGLTDFEALEVLCLRERVVGSSASHDGLREVDIQCPEVEQVLAAIAAGHWPALEVLVLSRPPIGGVPAEPRQGAIDARQLDRLFRGEATPKLRELKLYSVLDGRLSRALRGTPLTQRLELLRV